MARSMPHAQAASEIAASPLGFLLLCLLALQGAALDRSTPRELRGRAAAVADNRQDSLSLHQPEPSADNRPLHYLSFQVLGDLTNQWECIHNAGMLAAKMATESHRMSLVVPDLGRTAHGQFRDVYDIEHFTKQMASLGVTIVESVPEGLETVHLNTVAKKGLSGDLAAWSSTMKQYANKATHYVVGGEANLSWETNEARHLVECEKAYDLCKPVFQSLRYTPQIQSMSEQILEQLKDKGDWLAIHLHDFQGFLCGGGVDTEIKAIKERIVSNGISAKTLYIVGGTRDMENVKKILGLDGVEVVNKQSLLAETEGLTFQESAAVDQSIVRHAASYMSKPGSSFDALAVSIRLLENRPIKIYELPKIGPNCHEATAEDREGAAGNSAGYGHLVGQQESGNYFGLS